MGLEFLHRVAPTGNRPPARVAVFPGAYNPPTVAHLEIARAAAAWADEVLWVIPRAFPHKAFEGASFEQRCAMLSAVAREYTAFSAATSEGGLYAEIADEAREHFGADAEIALVCGRDAAERLATWDYGDTAFVDRMLTRYRLLVAARRGEYTPVDAHRHRITTLELAGSHDLVSSSEVRRRIEHGSDWQALVPPVLHQQIRAIYRPTAK